MNSPFRILIADDCALLRETLAELLNTLPGVEVAGSTQTVPQTIAAIGSGAFDAVILDFDLRGGSGLDVLEAIKRTPSAPVVIVFTVHTFEDLGSHCLEAGADFFFEKGYNPEGILNLLETLSLGHAQRVGMTVASSE